MESKSNTTSPDWTWEKHPEGDARREALRQMAFGRDSPRCKNCFWIEPPPGGAWLPGELEKKLGFEERAKKMGLKFECFDSLE